MIKKEVKNILIISRNVASYLEIVSLIKFNKEKSCNVYVCNCDVLNEKSLVRLLNDCDNTMLLIRDVIQEAM